MTKELELELVKAIYNYYVEYEKDKIIAVYSFSTSGSYQFFLDYKLNNGQILETRISPRGINAEINIIHSFFKEKIDSVNKFNKVTIEITSETGYEIHYEWNKQKELQEKIDSANVFYQWANDTMMNRIFDYEMENNLLTPNYDEDGDLIDYQDSWDKGLFEFSINENKIAHKITLFKDKIERNLPMPLPEYFTTGLLEHYTVTNTELTNEWEPWNTITIKSPNNSIPYNEWKDYVKYSLE
jgi:hypothetical protein